MSQTLGLRPPGPTSSPAANLYAMRREPISFFENLAAEYGDMVYFGIGGEGIYFLNHPDLVKEVLVTKDRSFVKWFAVPGVKKLLGNGLLVSDGEFHLRQRRFTQPAFHRQRIAGYAEIMVQYTQRWCSERKEGETVDIAEEMNKLTMMIVAKTLFGSDVDTEAKEISEALTTILTLFERSTLPTEEMEQFEAAKKRLDAVIYRIVKERRARGEQDTGDLLSMLLLAHDEGKEGMTDTQVRDELMTLFLAGHETTANALAWSWHAISQYPAVETKFHEELASVLQGRLPAMEDVTRLSYTKKIFNEALRLYPPVWALARQAVEPVQIGGYTIPQNAVVIISPFIAQRDARFFPEPECFDPERWTQEAEMARPRFSFFPFSAGSRQCLGEPFAWMEGVLVLAIIGQQWKLRPIPSHPIEFQPQLTLRAKYGIRMSLHRHD